jgi:histone demethylase JARID1
MNCDRRFPTKLQQIKTLQEGQGFDDGKSYTIAEYKEMADKFYRDWAEQHYGGIENIPFESLAKDYWDIVETGTKGDPWVEYGNDLDTLKYQSGFFKKLQADRISGVEEADSTDMFSDAYYARCGWNLNNLPHSDASVLKYLKTQINGVNVPWLYVGMLFTSFCWHTEDNYLYSINYNHFGGVKQWYGVPATDAKTFEKVSKDFLLENFKDSPDLLHHMTTQISPSLLIGKHALPCRLPSCFLRVKKEV